MGEEIEECGTKGLAKETWRGTALRPDREIKYAAGEPRPRIVLEFRMRTRSP
jgi:hypothetical protein